MKSFLFASGLVLAVTPAFASEEHLDIVHEQCGIQLGLTPSQCDCVRSGAADELNENQQAFMAARVTNNLAEINRLQSLMSQDEAVGVGTFMTSIVDRCP